MKLFSALALAFFIMTSLGCEKDETIVVSTTLPDGTVEEREVKRSVLDREYEARMLEFSHVIVFVNDDGSLRHPDGESMPESQLIDMLTVGTDKPKSLTIVADPDLTKERINDLYKLADRYGLSRVNWIHKDSFVIPEAVDDSR